MSFIKSFLDDREKSVNPAHAIALILVLASIGWVTYLVVHNHALPDLAGVAYLLGGSGAMNIAQKAEVIVDKFRKPDVSSVVAPVVPPKD
jgi:hypothetical protein